MWNEIVDYCHNCQMHLWEPNKFMGCDHAKELAIYEAHQAALAEEFNNGKVN